MKMSERLNCVDKFPVTLNIALFTLVSYLPGGSSLTCLEVPPDKDNDCGNIYR